MLSMRANFKTTLSLISAGVLFGAVVTLQGCGKSGSHFENNSASTQLESWKATELSERFSESDLKAVLTQGSSSQDGVKVPLQSEALSKYFNASSAPTPFTKEWGDFTAGVELRGYVNLAQKPDEKAQVALLSNLQAVSKWKTIANSEGKLLFADVFTTDLNGKKIPDVVTGNASPEGSQTFLHLTINGTFPLSVPVEASLTLYNREGEIEADIVNVKDVQIFPAGNVISAGGLKIHFRCFKQEQGWLVYGAAAVKLNTLEDALKPEAVQKIVGSIFNWIRNSTVEKLNSSAR